MNPTLRRAVFPVNALPSCQLVPEGIDGVLRSADVKFEALRRYYTQVPADVLFYFSDIVIQAEAMGAPVACLDGAMPRVAGPAPVISLPNPARVPRMVANAQVVRRASREFPDRRRVALVYGPFTVAGQVAGEENVLKAILQAPGEVLGLLEHCLECALRYGELLVEAGADLLWVSDPFAALVSPRQFFEFAGSFLRRLFERFAPLPTALHICGDTTHLVEAMVETGVGAISFDNCMDLLAVEDRLPEEVCIVGNLDPVEIAEMASPEQVADRTADLATLMACRKSFSLSTGCALPPATPVENVRAFVEAGRRTLAELEPHRPALVPIRAAVARGDRGAASEAVLSALGEGVPPLRVVTAGLMGSIRKASALYEAKRCHLPALLLMVEAFYQGFSHVEGKLTAPARAAAPVLLGTVQGDVHEIGKNLVRAFLETHGFRVVDLGASVSPERFLEAYRKHRPFVVGLSAFTTSARKQVAATIQAFCSRGTGEVALVVGGGAMTAEIARSLGAQGYARDAVQAVRWVEGLIRRPTRQVR